MLDIGGGFPAHHEGQRRIADYGHIIRWPRRRVVMTSALSSCSGPGVGSSATPGPWSPPSSPSSNAVNAVGSHLDAGVFTGLVETLEEAIRYRLETDRVGPVVPTVLAGPTCDKR